jgi:hypothetical protein
LTRSKRGTIPFGDTVIPEKTEGIVMWAPLSIALVLGSAGSLTSGHTGLGMAFAVLLVALLVFAAVRARRLA